MATGDLRTDKTWTVTLEDLSKEFGRWGMRDYVLPTHAEAKKAGKVVVRFAPNGQWADLECSIGESRYSRYSPEVSLRAIYLAVESARKADQRGIGGLLAKATQHLALPATSPYRILGVPEGCRDIGVLRKAYTERIMVVHPDHGGKQADFEAVQKAAQELGIK